MITFKLLLRMILQIYMKYATKLHDIFGFPSAYEMNLTFERVFLMRLPIISRRLLSSYYLS
jgi:hypothetical protein